ncbi:unnamed protein product [marine sediment metagenome]|uniref:Uncharacterized protein n=1 Tax=marine sediment metagenome TaxID=412755 RepID=X1I684_9ZZZZ
MCPVSLLSLLSLLGKGDKGDMGDIPSKGDNKDNILTYLQAESRRSQATPTTKPPPYVQK